MSAEKLKASMTEAEWEKIYEMSQDPKLFDNLIQSIFPSIHGNQEVKRGVALMLFGGVPKTTAEGTIRQKIRLVLDVMHISNSH